jgi:hypothetical protein
MRAALSIAFLLQSLALLVQGDSSKKFGQYTIQNLVKVDRSDPFLTPPEGFETAKPGTILRYRNIPRHLSLDNKNPVRVQNATQILYRTVNSVGEPEATVVTVVVPFNVKRDKLLGYHFFAVSLLTRFGNSMTDDW